MKTFLLILISLLLLQTSGNTFWFTKKEPKKTEEKVIVQSTPTSTPKPTIQDGRNLVKELSQELRSAKSENSKLKVSLDKASEKLKQAEQQTILVQKQADDLKEWGIIQQAEAQKFMEKYNSAVKRYHRLKAIAAVIAAAIGVMFGLQFMNLIPPPYSILIPLGGAGLFASLVWFFL